jgi:hypothetical protein
MSTSTSPAANGARQPSSDQVDVASTQPSSLAQAAKVFELRVWARSVLWQACEYENLHEAVDPLQADAIASGLVARLGQDQVQSILRDAFAKVRS